MQRFFHRPKGGAVLWCLLVLARAGFAEGTSRQVPRLPDALTLAHARQRAFERNPSLDAAKQRVEAALAAVRGARSDRFPQLDLSASATRLQDVSAASGGRLLRAPYEVYSLEANLQWLLFTGFRTDASVDSARAEASAAGRDWHDVRRVLSQAVGTAFYQTLLARERVEIAERDEEFNGTLEADAIKRQKAGTAGREHVLNFRMKANQARQQAVAARRDWRTSRTALAELLNLRPPKLPERVSLVVAEAEEITVPAIQKEVGYGMANRPDLKAQQRRLEQAKATLRQARSNRFPTVQASLSAGQTRIRNSALYNGADEDVAGTLTASYTAFSGGSTTADIEAAAARLAEARFSLARRRTSIASAIHQRHQRLSAALQQRDLAKQSADMGVEIRDIVRQKYQAGRVTLTRLNEVQTDAVRAQSQYAAARVRVLLARQNLNAATGRLEGPAASADPGRNPRRRKGATIR